MFLLTRGVPADPSVCIILGEIWQIIVKAHIISILKSCPSILDNKHVTRRFQNHEYRNFCNTMCRSRKMLEFQILLGISRMKCSVISFNFLSTSQIVK